MKILFYLICFLSFTSPWTHAAEWLKLNENSISILMIDKQSVLAQDGLKKAWVKVDYKRLHTNTESVEREYNHAKALWFFDCTKHKSATTQLFQYLDQELIYSGGVDVKGAEFNEPLPDSDVEIAMRYVCKPEKETKPTETLKKPPTVKQPITEPSATPAPTSQPKPPTNTTQTSAQPAPVAEARPSKAAPPTEKPSKAAEASKPNTKPEPKKPAASTPLIRTLAWAYDDKTGPEQWGKLKPEYQICDTGRNQSPVNIESTIHAALKPIRAIRKFAANDIALVDHALQVNFKKGNMMVLDSQPFQLKHLVLRMPSEHSVLGKNAPLEAQWHHEDSKGDTVVVSVLFKEDKKANPTIDKLLAQLPKDNKPIMISARITPDDLIPQDNRYYRYTGSLTTPPCTEGVRWVIMKTPLSVSLKQLESLTQAMPASNARPTQPLHGRILLE